MSVPARQPDPPQKKPPVCDSPFDVAFWLLDRALSDGDYLQPQKMHRLMYLAQAYYGAASRGQKLIPCVFVTSVFGPIEPTCFRAFENGRPWVDAQSITGNPKHFLDSLWRRFGAHSPEYLTKLTTNHPPYVEALAVGKRAEISFDSMIAYYGRRAPATAAAATAADGRGEAPPLESVLRPRVMRSHKGRPVNVHRWVPKRLGSSGGEGGDSSS